MAEVVSPLLHEAQSLLERRLVVEALQAFTEARRSGADPDSCEAGMWECLMLLNRHEEAWQISDAIDARLADAECTKPGRFWDGTPLAGRHVMLRCLHGFGDALQFIRYMPRLRDQAASVCIECHPEIAPLLRACDDVEQVISWESGSGEMAPAPFWDAQIEIMEVPRIHRAASATIPRTFPYLHARRLTATPSTVALTQCLEQRREKRRLQVGFSWRSSAWDPLRSIAFAQMAAVLGGVEGIDLYSLQRDGVTEISDFSAWHIENVEAPFGDLAVRMAALDCIVTVDGVLAHLAGALGKPVLLLLPHAADWRWGCGATTPWYPQTRLFRQQQSGDWAAPLAQARRALEHER